MSKIISILAASATLLNTATAHTAVEKFVIGGVEYPGFYQGSKQDPGDQSPAWWTEQGWGYQPIYGDAINTADFICHIGASPSPYTVEAPAGSDITFTWKHEGECGTLIAHAVDTIILPLDSLATPTYISASMG